MHWILPRDELLVPLFGESPVAIVADTQQLDELDLRAVLKGIADQLGQRIEDQPVALDARHTKHGGHNVEQRLDLWKL